MMLVRFNINKIEPHPVLLVMNKLFGYQKLMQVSVFVRVAEGEMQGRALLKNPFSIWTIKLLQKRSES